MTDCKYAQIDQSRPALVPYLKLIENNSRILISLTNASLLYRCISSRTGASTPKNSPLIMGKFCAYAIFNRSSMVLAHTILPSADDTTTPPQLQHHQASLQQRLLSANAEQPGMQCDATTTTVCIKVNRCKLVTAFQAGLNQIKPETGSL